MKKPTVVVIGGANLDIKGKATGPLMPRTSNPGRVNISPGGVARNIAEDLALLGVRSILISAFGTDEFAQMLVSRTRAAGVEVDDSLFDGETSTSVFVALMNHRGDLDAGIADMGILDRLTPAVLRQREPIICSADFIVLDADLPRESLEYLTTLGKQHGIPICIEPVGVAKALRMVEFVGRVAMVTPNREEAEALVGFPLNDMKGIAEAGVELMRRGVKWVIITLGPEGVYVASEDRSQFLASIATIVNDSVGAGDALVAGVIYGLVTGTPFFDSVKMGVAAATMTLMTPDAVNRGLSRKALDEVMERIPAD